MITPQELEKAFSTIPEDVGRSRRWGAKMLYVAFRTLEENGGLLSPSEIMKTVEEQLLLDSWCKEVYRSGQPRWKQLLRFFSIEAVKSGFLVRKEGKWILTPEGREVISSRNAWLLMKKAGEGYAAWSGKRQHESAVGQKTIGGTPEDIEAKEGTELTIEAAQEAAIEGLKQAIREMGPYEFQDLVAALLRGMGYFTPLIAPPGKDGGIDIVAYRDPIGAIGPRVRVQVKHRANPVSVQEIRALIGILGDNDIGLFVSSGGFTADARNAARDASKHVELIDLERFLEMWKSFYNKMSDEDRARLPLIPVYFLAPREH